MDPLVKPVWEGEEVLNESFLPLRAQDGGLSPIRLMYEADEVFSVRSATLDAQYEAGRDYCLDLQGQLCIPAGSHIPVMDYEDYYPARGDGSCFPHSEGGYIRFGEGAYFHKRQLVVSYRHKDKWKNAVPADKSALLPSSIKLLSSGSPIRMLLFGDSISTGVNASGAVSAPPFQKPWFELLVDGLKEKYHTNAINFLNTSVGGKTSNWGRDTAKENAAALRPDLCVIAFGMNDGSCRKPPDVFIANIEAIRLAVLEQNPDCEFVLVATALANSEVKGFAGLQESYLEPMLRLERTGICVADMTSLHKALLSRKAFRDMSGNNVNHPNDFLSRVYAQLMLRTLGAV